MPAMLFANEVHDLFPTLSGSVLEQMVALCNYLNSHDKESLYRCALLACGKFIPEIVEHFLDLGLSLPVDYAPHRVQFESFSYEAEVRMRAWATQPSRERDNEIRAWLLRVTEQPDDHDARNMLDALVCLVLVFKFYAHETFSYDLYKYLRTTPMILDLTWKQSQTWHTIIMEHRTVEDRTPFEALVRAFYPRHEDFAAYLNGVVEQLEIIPSLRTDESICYRQFELTQQQ